MALHSRHRQKHMHQPITHSPQLSPTKPRQPIRGMSGCAGGNKQPISGVSVRSLDQWAACLAAPKRLNVCRGPISGLVLPAGAGDWWWGAAAALSGPDREPGDGTHWDERRTQVSPRMCTGAWLRPRCVFLKWQRRDSELCRCAAGGYADVLDRQ